MDEVLNQVFDTLADKVKIAHAKDVARAGADKSRKHADIGDEDALASHTFRGVGEIVLNAPGTGALNYDLDPKRLSEKHPNIPSSSSILMRPMFRARRNSSTTSSSRMGYERQFDGRHSETGEAVEV